MPKIYIKIFFFEMICVNGRISFFLVGLLEKVAVLFGKNEETLPLPKNGITHPSLRPSPGKYCMLGESLPFAGRTLSLSSGSYRFFQRIWQSNRKGRYFYLTMGT